MKPQKHNEELQQIQCLGMVRRKTTGGLKPISLFDVSRGSGELCLYIACAKLHHLFWAA